MARRKAKLPPLQLPPRNPAGTDPLAAAFKSEAAAAALARAGSAAFAQTFEDFFRATAPSPNYCWGTHTRAIAAKMQQVVARMERGELSHVIVNVPPRHGKSDQVSRRFPVFRLMRHPEWEVMLATANADLAKTMAISARRCFEEQGPKFGLRYQFGHNEIMD